MTWWKNRRLWPAYFLLGSLLFVAVARDILANGRPLYCRIQGETYFPGLRSWWQDPDRPFENPELESIRTHFGWRHYDYETAVFAPIPFSPGELPMSPDTTVFRVRPGAIHPGPKPHFRHWLGTDTNGYDVAAGLVSGARIAMLTGILAVVVAFGIGLTLGALAGFWGDDRLRIRRGQLLAAAAGFPFAWFYAGIARQLTSEQGNAWFAILLPALVFFCILLAFSLLGKFLSRWWPWLAKPVLCPVDLAVMRLAEVFNSVPGLLVIIAFAAMLQSKTQSIWVMIALIGAFSWTNIARFVRSELLRIRELDYVTAARGMGLDEWRILLRHALPNALQPVYVAIAFGVAEAILLEAALSFLGYGDNSLDGATWGSLLQNARSSPQLWWISLFPGLLVTLSILALHSIGEQANRRR